MDRYNRQVAAARKTGLELTRRQQTELSSLLQDFADELGDRIRSGFGTTNDILLEREVRNLIRELHSGVSSHILKHSRLQARAMAEMHARAHNDALGAAGLSGEAFQNRMTAASANLAQAVFAQDGITKTFRTLRRGTARQAQLILKRASIRGSSIDSVEKQMRLLVQGADSIPAELLVDRRLISKRTLTEYFGIESPTNEEVAAVRRAARAVAGRSRLISRTSMMNVEHEATAVAMAQSPIVAAGQWFLSNRHTDFDQCDALATSDFYELGGGVYPSDAIPPRPHPRCLCGVQHILRPVSEWGTLKPRGGLLKLNPKTVAERLGLNKSQTTSLRQALGTAELRFGVGLAARSTLKNKLTVRVLNTLTGSALTLDTLNSSEGEFAKVELFMTLVRGGLLTRTVSMGAQEYFKIVGAAGLGTAAVGQGFFAVQRLIRKRAREQAEKQAVRAARRAARSRVVEGGGGVEVGARGSFFDRKSSPRRGEGGVKLLDDAVSPPVHPVRDNLKRNLEQMETWMANQSNEVMAIYSPEGRLLTLTPGGPTSAPLPGLPFGTTRGAWLTHNHPPWATTYDNPETWFTLGHSKGDLILAMNGQFGGIRTTTPFATYSLSPRRGAQWDASALRLGSTSTTHAGRNSFVWRTMEDFGDIIEDFEDISRVSVSDRFDDLYQRFDEHLRVRKTVDDPGFWNFGDEVGEMARFNVFPADDQMLAARRAGIVRAVTEEQFEEVLRLRTFEMLAREYDWDFKVVNRKTPLTGPHRAPITFDEYVRYNQAHAKLFVAGTESVVGDAPRFDFGAVDFSDMDSAFSRMLDSRRAIPHLLFRSRKSPSIELQLGRFKARDARLGFLTELRDKLPSMPTVARAHADVLIAQVAESMGLVPKSLAAMRVAFRNPMRVKETIDDLLGHLGNVVSDRYMTPAIAWRSQVQRGMDIRHRLRFPGRPNSKTTFPALLKPETSDLPPGFFYKVTDTGDSASFSSIGDIKVSIVDKRGDQIASVFLTIENDLNTQLSVKFASNIVVSEPFRRRGLATALNVRVDELFPNLVVQRGDVTLLGAKLRLARVRRNVLNENIDLLDNWLTPQTAESMVILNSRGHPIAFRQGTTGSVSLKASDRVLMEGATVLHNHPPELGNLSFDIQDLFELAEGRARKGVLTTRRYRYEIFPRADNQATLTPASFLRRSAGRTDETIESIFKEFDDLLREGLIDAGLDDSLKSRFVIASEADRLNVPLARRAAAITLDEAEEQAQHFAVQQFADRRGWGYTRTERAVPNLDAPVLPMDPIDAAVIAKRVELDFDRVAVLTAKRDRLRELVDAFDDVGDSELIDELFVEFNDRIASIDDILAAGDPEVGHLNVPRWIRRSIEEVEEDHEIAQLILDRLVTVNPDFVRGSFEKMALKWRDLVEPKLRALGFTEGGFDFSSGLGSGMRARAPLASSRILNETTIRELDGDLLKAYAARFESEFGFDLDQIIHDIAILDDVDMDAIRFGAGESANMPDAVRGIAKHRVQRGTALAVVNTADKDGVLDFWLEVYSYERDTLGIDSLDFSRALLSNGSYTGTLDSQVVAIRRVLSGKDGDRHAFWRKRLLDIADDVENGVKVRFQIGAGEGTDEIRAILSVIERKQESGLSMRGVAEAIRHEVMTDSASRKWRSHDVTMSSIIERNAIEELAAAMGLDPDTAWKLDKVKLFLQAKNDLSDEQLFRALHRTYLRTHAERSVSGMVSTWAAGSGGNPASIAFQFAVDEELGVVRAAKRFMGSTDSPLVKKRFRRPFFAMHTDRLDKARDSLRHVSEAKLVREMIEETLEDVAAGRVGVPEAMRSTFLIDPAGKVNFVPPAFARRIKEELDSGVRVGGGIFTQNDDGTFSLVEIISKLDDLLDSLDLPQEAKDFALTLKLSGTEKAREVARVVEQGISAIAEMDDNVDTLVRVMRAARKELRRFEAAHSVPLPASFVALKPRLDRLRQATNKVNKSISRLEDAVSDFAHADFSIDRVDDAVKELKTLKDRVKALRKFDSMKTAVRNTATHMKVRLPSGGYVLEAIISEDTFLPTFFVKRPGSPFGRGDPLFPPGAKLIANTTGDVISDDKVVSAVLAMTRRSDMDVFERAVALEALGLNRDIAERISGARVQLTLRAHLDAWDLTKTVRENPSVASYAAFLDEQIEPLRRYVVSGDYDRDLARKVLRQERVTLSRRLQEQIDDVQKQLNDFFIENPEHAIFAQGTGAEGPIILDEFAFREALREANEVIDEGLDAGWELFQRDKDFMRRVVRAMYEDAQAKMKFVGPRAQNLSMAKTFAVQRAREAGYAKIVLETGEELIVDARAAARLDARILVQTTDSQDWLDAMGVFDVREVTKPMDEIILWRGVGLSEDAVKAMGFDQDDWLGRVVTMRFQPLNSFSTSPMGAAKFVRSDDPLGRVGAMHMVKVDKKQIFSTPYSGPGCLCEHEFTVLGGSLDTVTWIDDSTKIDWWDILGRMRISGFVPDDELARWAGFVGLQFNDKSSWVPSVGHLKNLGMVGREAVGDVLDKIEDAFKIDWDTFDDFWQDVQNAGPQTTLRRLKIDILDEFVLSDKIIPYLNKRDMTRLYPDIEWPTTDALSNPFPDVESAIDFIEQKGGSIQKLIDFIEPELANYEVLDLREFTGLEAAFEEWYRDNFFDNFVVEFLESGEAGLTLSGDTDHLDLPFARLILQEPDLTR